ncbi:MAG: hypothetical protein R2838_21545 [Caldilineaceae bacterium]
MALRRLPTPSNATTTRSPRCWGGPTAWARDYTFATVGSPKAIEQSFAMVRQGGTAVIVGMPLNDQMLIPLNAHHFTYGRTITGKATWAALACWSTFRFRWNCTRPGGSS